MLRAVARRGRSHGGVLVLPLLLLALLFPIGVAVWLAVSDQLQRLSRHV